MAEREGFEPSVELSPHTRLAGERLQPARPSLRDADESAYYWLKVKFNPLNFLAEGVGFEPTELSLNGFQDRRLQPLGHPSQRESHGYHFEKYGSIFYLDIDMTFDI